VVALNLGHSTLGIARALDGFASSITAFAAKTDDIGQGSRLLKVIRAPDSAQGDGRPLLAALIDHAQSRGERPALFPTRDLDVVFIDRFRSELSPHFRIAQAPSPTLERIINKVELTRAAADLGIPTPRTLVFDRVVPGDVAIPDDLRYPVILKAIYAHQPRALGVSVGATQPKAHVAPTASDALGQLRLLLRAGVSVFLQEFVPGATERLVICAGYASAHPHRSGAFTARKRLQYPRDAGIGHAVETIHRPDLMEATLKLLASLGYQGIFEAEYKEDSEGRAHLIEINPRHWDQHLLGTACGINVTRLALQDLFDLDADPPVYRFQRALWLNDAFALRLRLTRAPEWAELAAQLRAESPPARRMPSVFRKDDPLPALFAYTRQLGDLAGALRRASDQRLRSALSRATSPRMP
jgi:predicted ATP-grasp superfamily ATP-dependent carboligase